ncbi:DJ-1 family glyoxalase III [Geovibrio ferrireducens]|jgi:4-methyl-5(b-hydroxyethyl)-thiazole monophosphate biosynthesis|uniref:DJ-1 family glyoxalase III n=1 Tax=Geovibrio ferrireducens TaxID=46201 RepID=UPI0022485A21|nr:DJ-1 family glyoxalase III [Geovibrio ferrireducens]
MAKIALILADGFEEIEALGTADILRRAKADVFIAGLREGAVSSSRGVRVLPDGLIDSVNADDFDAIVLPGGQPGADNLNADRRVIDLLYSFNEKGKLICAICAAPYILAEKGFLKGKKATCFPSYAEVLGESYVEKKVVEDGNIITSRGPATAPDFAFAIVDRLIDKRITDTLKKAMLYYCGC